MAPGGNKFGGTLRVINNGFSRGLFKAKGDFYYFWYESNPTPRLLGPMYVGGYGIAGGGFYTNTGLTSIMFVTSFHVTTGPYTTGLAYAYQTGGQAATKVTLSGYDNRTVTTGGRIKGTVSLVQPLLVQVFRRAPTTSDPVFSTGVPFGFVTRLRITFLPEPGWLLSLGCGLLAVGVLYRARGR
jgi:hypothetical protein